jgi:hypothetical protein
MAISNRRRKATAAGEAISTNATDVATAYDKASGGARGDDLPALHEEISSRAYTRFCERGCVHGYALDDWIAAEAEVLAERAARAARRTT